jgi:P4 family phage/plasmid primase-like protien
MSAQPAEFYTSSFSADEPDRDSISVQLSKFLEPFFPDTYEEINLRAFVAKGASQIAAIKIATCREQIETDEDFITRIMELNVSRGLYFVVNSGGDDDDNITTFSACFSERDGQSIAEQHAALDACPLQPSMRVETKNSVHAYWSFQMPIKRARPELQEEKQALLFTAKLNLAEWQDTEKGREWRARWDEWLKTEEGEEWRGVGNLWREAQKGLIAFFGSDPAIKNPSRVMRLPYFNHLAYNKEDKSLSYKPVELVEFHAERRYTIEQMIKAFPPPPEPPKPKYKPSTGEFNAWDSLHNELHQRIMASGRRNSRGMWEKRCGAHHGKSDTSLFYNPITGAVFCHAGCTFAHILLSEGLPTHPVNSDEKQKLKVVQPSDGSNDNNNTGGGAEPEEIRCSDMGNGFRFARQHKDKALFCYVSDKWSVWDGKRWIEDNSGEAVRLAKTTVKNIYTEAAFTVDEEKRKAIGKHALRSEGDSRITAMLHQAQSEMPVKLEAFDQDTFAFNCEDGTLDLRTGELRPHAREDFITKLSSVVYNDQAKCPKWETFLNQIFEDDEELITFIQKAIGYSLTGSTEEQCFFIGYGTGANGKSVFLKTVAALVDEYGQQVRSETLMTKKYQGVSNDIACLRGARFLSAVETDAEHRLAEATVKQLTGGDAVRARFLFQEEFEFSPQFKLWLACNHKPTISNDNAIWRRIRLIPFGVTILKEEQNPRLDLELREELPGILAWAVRGCLLWQHQGLGEPAAVQQATSDYREEMDTLSAFFADRCELSENFQVTSNTLYAAYGAWCDANGETALTQRLLGMQLKERGFKVDRKFKGRFWQGIGIRGTGEGDD